MVKTAKNIFSILLKILDSDVTAQKVKIIECKKIEKAKKFRLKKSPKYSHGKEKPRNKK